MLAFRIFEAGAEEGGLGWLVWVVLAVFLLMVFLGWLVVSKGWLKQEEEIAPEQHELDVHDPVEVYPAQADDLTTIEGVGPKVAELLAGIGVTTFASLAEADLARLREVLDSAGYKYMEPAGWIEQAKLAAKGDHAGLQKLQDELKGGRKAG